MPDQRDGGQGAGVGVVDHGGPGRLVEVEAQRCGVTGQAEGPGGSRGGWTGAVGGLAERAADREVTRGRGSLDRRPIAPVDESEQEQAHPERCRRDQALGASEEERAGEHQAGEADADDAGSREAEEEAATLAASEPDRRWDEGVDIGHGDASVGRGVGATRVASAEWAAHRAGEAPSLG